MDSTSTTCFVPDQVRALSAFPTTTVRMMLKMQIINNVVFFNKSGILMIWSA